MAVCGLVNTKLTVPLPAFAQLAWNHTLNVPPDRDTPDAYSDPAGFPLIPVVRKIMNSSSSATWLSGLGMVENQLSWAQS
jgi:hypothetical protein